MDTTRLRRAFRYAEDDDPSDEPEVLDEQEQDALIQTLAEQNQRRNEQFRRLLLAVPVLAMIPVLVACVSPSSARSSPVVISLLGLSSLGATAYLVHRLPATQTGIPALDAWSSGKDVKGKGPAAGAAGLLDLSPSSSPLDRYLPLLNIGLCAMLLLSLFLVPARGGSSPSSGLAITHYLLLSSVPAAVYAVVLVAKATMAGVDPERELSRLRYEYKGA